MSRPEETAGEQESGKLDNADQRIGVFFLQSADGASAAIDIRSVAEYASHLPGVSMVRTMQTAGLLKPETLAIELHKEKLNAVVLVSDIPVSSKPPLRELLCWQAAMVNKSAWLRLVSAAMASPRPAQYRWSTRQFRVFPSRCLPKPQRFRLTTLPW